MPRPDTDNQDAIRAAQIAYGDLMTAHNSLLQRLQTLQAEHAALSHECAGLRAFADGDKDSLVSGTIHAKELLTQQLQEHKAQLRTYESLVLKARQASGSTSVETIDFIVRDMRAQNLALREVMKAAEALAADANDKTRAALAKACATVREIDSLSLC